MGVKSVFVHSYYRFRKGSLEYVSNHFRSPPRR